MASGLDPNALLKEHGITSVMRQGARRMVDVLEPSEPVAHLALARLKWLPRGGEVTQTLQILGGLLAVTDRRVLYTAATIVLPGSQFLRGNDLVEVPFTAIQQVTLKRGKGLGDARKLLSLTLYGSRLTLLTHTEEQRFVEIKPLQVADEMQETLRRHVSPSG